MKNNEIEQKTHDLVRVADSKKTLSKSNTTNWRYKIYIITEIVNDTVPSYKVDEIQERYNQALLKKTQVTLREKK